MEIRVTSLAARKFARTLVGGALALTCACAEDERGQGAGGPSGDTAETSAPGDSTASSGTTRTEPLLDVGETGAGGDGDRGRHCQAIDFVFVVDNSSSMADNQLNLISSFPGFIDAIFGELEIDDFRILVIDSDRNGAELCEFGGCPSFAGAPFGCDRYECGSIHEDPCDTALGAGVIAPRGGGASNRDCGIEGGHRWIGRRQPALADTFRCVAQVGVTGAGNEENMTALMSAVGTHNQTGGCNEGFLRDEALLVVTVLSDAVPEFSDEQVGADPKLWHDTLVRLKGGQEAAVVAVGLIEDGDQSGGLCADAGAPAYREFFELFGDRAFVGSACAPDYAPTFAEAVRGVVDACHEFAPAG